MLIVDVIVVEKAKFDWGVWVWRKKEVNNIWKSGVCVLWLSCTYKKRSTFLHFSFCI